MTWRDLTADEFMVLRAAKTACRGQLYAIEHADSIEPWVPQYAPRQASGAPMPVGTRRVRRALRELAAKNLLVRAGRAMYGLHIEGLQLVREYDAWQASRD